MIYCMSDIHGDYDAYISMLRQINLKESDTLYVLGDILDRGDGAIRILKDMMVRINVFPILGNHEYMAFQCLELLMGDGSLDSLARMDEDTKKAMMDWIAEGGQQTMEDFRKLSEEEKESIVEYLEDFDLYQLANVGGKEYVMVHAGLDNFFPERDLDEYDITELIFNSPDFSRVYYPDKYLVTGHNPTEEIPENPKKNYIYRANNHIAIDCGCSMGGRLGCICLDTGEEFYSDQKF